MMQSDTIKALEINLPLPPEVSDGGVLDIYTRFMSHLRCVPTSRMEIKVLAAIQFVADFLDYSDAHVAKVLVELGLRAPRMAFSAEFLRFADQSLMREAWEIGGPSVALTDLQDFWGRIGEDRFAGVRQDYPFLVEEALV